MNPDTIKAAGSVLGSFVGPLLGAFVGSWLATTIEPFKTGIAFESKKEGGYVLQIVRQAVGDAGGD